MWEHVRKIVSGAQTGPDRAALDFARSHSLGYGGWVPLGGLADDFPEAPGLLADYPRLTEAPDEQASTRTMLNVRDSDATLVIWPLGIDSPGCDLTAGSADVLGRPLLVSTDEAEIRSWAHQLRLGSVLNVAGPRAAEWPAGYADALNLLERLWVS